MVNLRADHHRAYREKNRAALAEKKRQWRLDDLEQEAANRAAYRAANKEYIKAGAAARYIKNDVRIKAVAKAWKLAVRLKVITHYGGKCACCGEARLEFLAIDHINGNGNKHRRSIKINGGSAFYSHLVKLGLPPEFRVLCHNCNMALGHYGYCPHQKE